MPAAHVSDIWPGIWSLRLSRFAAIGVASTVLYAALALAFSHLGIGATGASVLAFLLAAVFSYAGHKYVTFVSGGRHAFELPRFLALSGAGLAVVSDPAGPADGHAGASRSGSDPACLRRHPRRQLRRARQVGVPGRRMSDVVTADGSRTGGPARLPLFWMVSTLAVVLVAAAAYALNAWRWGTVPDTSWPITVIERVAAGERLYIDVIELNPPFSIWLYMVPVRLAMALGVEPESAVRLYTILLCLAGSALTGWLLAASGLLARRSAALASVALFAVAVLVSGNAFSERDQIGAMLGLPLLILAAWRALPAPQPSPKALHWLAAGAGAGVLAMVKPYYAVIVVAAACMLALKRRDIRVFFLPEFVLSGVITAAYLGLSYALYPAFFETLLPVLRDTYMAYRRPWTFCSWLPCHGWRCRSSTAFNAG